MNKLDLFGNNIINIPKIERKKNKTLFDNYDEFVDKFKVKKTTDDCYTPTIVYDIILNFVNNKIDLSKYKIIRPFYPGGDYESIDYTNNCIVIDNPPFSIMSKIVRFYIDRNIKFFLFSNHLTLFSSNMDCTYLVCGATIIYENGAKVSTSFLSNMFGNIKIMSVPDLYTDLSNINKKVNLPKYKYPINVLTVSMVQKYVENGIHLEIDKNNVYHCKGLDSQKVHKKTLFGSGFLISDKAAVDIAVADKAVANKKNIIVWELSNREKDIIKSLGCK